MSSLRRNRVRAAIATTAAVMALTGTCLTAVPAQGQSQVDRAAQGYPVVDRSPLATSAQPTSAATAGAPAVPRRGKVLQRGIPIRKLAVSSSGAVVTASVSWNQQMIARKGNRDRFNVRLVAFGAGGAAKPIVLSSTSTKKRPPVVQKVTIRLGVAMAKQVRTSSDVVLAISQQYGLNGTHGNKYFRQYVTVKKTKAGSKARVSGGWSDIAARTRAGRDCRTIKIRPGADLSGCGLSRANLSVCDLSGVNLTGAILSGAILRGCDLTNTRLAGANLTGVVSGGITGTPASLPTGWALVNGVLTKTRPARLPTDMFAVTYADDSADSGTVPVDGSNPYVAGATVTVAENTGSLIKAGNTFGGWSDGITTRSPADTFTMPAAAVTLTAVWTVAVSCATGRGAAGTCVVGDTGPGGGEVFYVHEPNLDGSRYMEAVPATWSGQFWDPGFAWCYPSPGLIAGTFGTAIGTGKLNTDNMVADGACTNGAANIVRAYGTTGAPAGSWSLPSLDELNALDVSGVGGLSSFNAYWSSSQSTADNARYQFVGIGGGADSQGEDYALRSFVVRPVRAF